VSRTFATPIEAAQFWYAQFHRTRVLLGEATAFIDRTEHHAQAGHEAYCEVCALVSRLRGFSDDQSGAGA
jgi:hypothetical protein